MSIPTETSPLNATTPRLERQTSPTMRPHPIARGVARNGPLPAESAGFWRQMGAFAGPAFLVSVGYMDPGNWATDLKAGDASFAMTCSGLVAAASFMAIIMQVISALPRHRHRQGPWPRLAVIFFPVWSRWPMWIFCEIAIAACDLAEVVGSAVALNLLFHIPLPWAVVITAFDVLLLPLPCKASACGSSKRSSWCSSPPSPCATSSRFSCCLRRSRISWRMGQELATPGFRRKACARSGHRHHRSDGDAAQPLPPFGAGAVAATAGGMSRQSGVRSASIRLTPLSLFRSLFSVNAAILVLAAVVFNGHKSVVLSNERHRGIVQ